MAMSGQKETYVSVSQRELQRMREQESRLRIIQNDLPERLNEVRRQSERELQRRMQPVEDRQRRCESAVKGLTSELRKVEREMVKLVSDERRQREQAVNHLQRQINDVTANVARKQDIAHAFISDLTIILEETRKLPHERFAPGQMDAFQRNIRDARENLGAGISEAALSTAQKAYWELVDLRTLVRQRESEFIKTYQAALEEARAILEEARANRTYSLELGSGAEANTLEMEVDYWTHGELSALEQEIQSMERQLISGESSLSTEAVKDILLSLESDRSKIQEIVGKARDNILSSQLRFNVAETVVQALASQGFVVEAGVYECNDQRNAYIAKVKNIAGTEIVTVISPVGEEPGKNRVSINSYEKTYVAEETLKQRAQDVVRLLAEDGLDVASPKCRGDADHSYQDIAAVASRQQVSSERLSAAHQQAGAEKGDRR